jgi:hypothetical protein
MQMGGWEESKRFFFEKKKQKTFTTSPCAEEVGAWTPDPNG